MLRLNIGDHCLKKSKVEFVFVLSNHIKQTRPDCPVQPAIVPRYPLDIDICPYACLERYINQTQVLRHDDTLFVSAIKPHLAVGSQTFLTWIKEVLQMSGIDCELFKPIQLGMVLPQQPIELTLR